MVGAELEVGWAAVAVTTGIADTVPPSEVGERGAETEAPTVSVELEVGEGESWVMDGCPEAVPPPPPPECSEFEGQEEGESRGDVEREELLLGDGEWLVEPEREELPLGDGDELEEGVAEEEIDWLAVALAVREGVGVEGGSHTPFVEDQV